MRLSALFLGFASGVLFFTGFMGLWQLAEQPNPQGCYVLPLQAESWLPPFSLITVNGCLRSYYAADAAGFLLLFAFVLVLVETRRGKEGVEV